MTFADTLPQLYINANGNTTPRILPLPTSSDTGEQPSASSGGLVTTSHQSGGQGADDGAEVEKLRRLMAHRDNEISEFLLLETG